VIQSFPQRDGGREREKEGGKEHPKATIYFFFQLEDNQRTARQEKRTSRIAERLNENDKARKERRRGKRRKRKNNNKGTVTSADSRSE